MVGLIACISDSRHLQAVQHRSKRALYRRSPQSKRKAAVGKWAKLCKFRFLRTADLGAQCSMGASVCYSLNDLCGWLPHCKRFLAISAVIFVSTVVCPACLCFGIASTGPDEFRKRGSNRLIDLKGPLPFPECPCSWLT